MIKRSSLLALKIVVGLLAVCALVFGGLVWRLSQGPISLGFVKEPFESLINASAGDIRVGIRDVVIERGEDGSGIRFRLRGIELSDQRGVVVARAPRAAVGVSTTALLRGRFVPSRLELIGPRINLTREANGSFRLGFDEAGAIADTADTAAQPTAGQAEGAPQQATAESLTNALLASLADPRRAGGAAGMELISIRGAVVSLYDEDNEAQWFAPNANLDFSRVEEGILLSGNMTVESGNLPWQLGIEAQYRKETDDFNIIARVRDFVPAEIAGKLSVLSNLAEVRLPLSGRVSILVNRQGRVDAADGHFIAGAGFLGFPGVISDPVLIDEGEVNLRLDGTTGTVLLTDSSIDIGNARASLEGSFQPVTREGVFEALEFDLQVNGTGSDGRGSLLIDRLLLGGVADLLSRRIDISRFVIEAGDAQIVAAGRVTEGKHAPGLIVRGKVANLPFDVLKRIWPPLAAPGARKWFIEHASHGVINEADVRIDLTPQALSDGLNDRPIPNEFIDVTFSYAGATVDYFGELPAIRNGTGTGHLRGDEFVLTMGSGVAGNDEAPVKVAEGRFHVDDFAMKAPVSDIRITISGTSETALRVLDSRPLEYMKKFGLDPGSVGGNAKIDLAMSFPLRKDLRLDEIQLKAQANLSELTLANVFRGAHVEDGDITLDVNTGGLTGRGDVVIAGVPAKLEWTERFEANGGDSSTFIIETTLDDAHREKLGIDLKDLITGPVAVKLTASGKGPSITRAHVQADLSSALVFYRPIGWVYPSTKDATATFDLEFGSGYVRLHDMTVKGPDLRIAGAVRFDNAGRVIAIDLADAALGPKSRLTVTGQRNDKEVLELSVSASSFDARPLLKSRLKQAGSESPSAGNAARDRVVVSGAVAQATAFNGETFSNVSFTMHSRNDMVETLNASGNISGRGKFSVSIGGDGKGGRALRIDSSDAGSVLRAVDLYSKISGGDFRLSMNLPAPGADPVRAGELKLKDFQVKNEKVLREIPLDARRDSLASNAARNDFSFSSLTIPFLIDDGVMRIDRAFLKGPAIGASAQGVVDTRTASLDLGGTLIPAYELNSFISHVPLIGDVLTGGKGEGVFGVTFAVTGTTERPRIQINPVSALMPGIFRKMFEFGGSGRGPGDAPHDGAVFDEPSHR